MLASGPQDVGNWILACCGNQSNLTAFKVQLMLRLAGSRGDSKPSRVKAAFLPQHLEKGCIHIG